MSSQPAQTLKSGQLLPELVSARGLAAVWIVLAHTFAKSIEGHSTLPHAIEYSRVIVDFFFVLSGFVLAHMYDPAWREGRFGYVNFLCRRLVRLYPLHLATLLVCLAIVLAGRMLGVSPAAPHDVWSFTATALLLHSTWATTDLAWNWPSWSVSAEWCAYLAIPLFLAAADRFRTNLSRICVGLGAFVAAAAFAELVLKQDVVELTSDGGAFRIIPSFFAGILLRRMFDEEPALTRMTPRIYAAVVAGVLATCAGLIALEMTYDALWPAMVVLVAALASRGTWTAPGILRGRTLAWLGELSYALYMTHAIALQVVFALAERFGMAETLASRFCFGLLSILTTMVGAHLAYVLVERPGRRVMATLLGLNRPKPPVAAAETGGVTP